jgi:hypothetical protein
MSNKNSKTLKFVAGITFALALVIGSSASAAITTQQKQGSRGPQVLELQQFLNNCSAETMVASTGAGSKGMETSYFGPATKRAVIAFQNKFGIATTSYSAGLVGPATRAKIAAGCGTNNNNNNNTTSQTGAVKAMLATDTTPASSFIAPSSGVEFAKFTFTGAGAVTSVKLTRTGVSSSSTLSNVYLYDGATRLTDGSSISSDNTVTFNSISGIFTVNGSKTISVVADTLTNDYSLGFTLSSFTAGGVATNVSIAGNQLYGASATLSTLALSAATGSGATDPGADITVWQSTASNSTRDVILKSLALRNIGSIASTDINNFKLYADGVLVSTVANLDSNGYVTFTPNTVLKTGARVLKVTADVIGGSGRTVSMSLRGAFDIKATDTQYNANGTATGTFPNTATAFSVNPGTLTVVKAAGSPSANVTLGAPDQSLAKYTFTAYGEPVKVETLRVGMITTGGTVTDNTLRNVRILVNGAQVGSNTSVPAAATFAAASGTSFTTNFMVYPGTPATVEIHADIFDNEGTDDIAAGTTTAVQALLVGGTSTANGVPQVSLGTINVPTATNVLGNNLTISSGSMSLAKTSSYASQTIAVPQTAYKIGSFQLSGNSTEAVNLNTIYVGFADTSSDAAPATDLSDLYVVYGGTQSSVKGTVTCTYSSGCTNPNSWSINKTLAVNEVLPIDVYATIASSLSTNSFIPTLAIAGTTANSGIATYADASGTTSLTAGVSGQEITGGTGTITASLDAANTSASQLVDDSGTFKSLTFKIAAVTDSYTVTDATITVSNVSAVSTVTLKDHDTGAIIGAAKPAATSLTWSGLTLPVNAGQTVLVDVELALAPVGVGAGTSDASLATVLTAFTARNLAGTSATGTGTATGNTSYIYKAIPVITPVTTNFNTNLTSGTTMTLAKFTVGSNGTGTIAWKQAMFEVTKTAWAILATPTLWNADTNTQITAAIVFQNDTNTDAACNASDTACEILVSIGTNADDDTVETVSGGKTYELRSAITGTQATGYVSTTLDRNTTVHAAKGAYTANDNATTANSTSFEWSDESASATSDTGVSTWLPDFLVKGIPGYWSLNRS